MTGVKKQKLKNNLKKLKFERENETIAFAQEFSSIVNYKNSIKYINKKSVDDIIEQYWY